MKEEWKLIDFIVSDYYISNYGRAKSIKHGEKILKQTRNSRGYFTICLYANGIRKTKSIHQLVAKAFIPNPENLPLVRHKNDIQTDNNVNNLMWGTVDDNIKDAIKNNIKLGSKPKLTKELSENIFNDYINSELTQKQISKKYNISLNLVQKTIKRFKKTHLNDILLKKQKTFISSKKIKKEDVLKIRHKFDIGLNTIKELAEEFNVSQVNISLLVRRKIFKNV